MYVWETFIYLLKIGGEPALRRALTMPRSKVAAVCAKTGANLDQAIEERDEAVEQTVQFVLSMVDHDFEDPD
jgi:hypothetical protein